LGVGLKKVDKTLGSLEVGPRDDIVRGLSASDVRFRNYASAWLIDGGTDAVYAGGQLGVKHIGDGRLVVCQFDPNRFNADKLTYFRLSRWRQTRAMVQVLANLGASFSADRRIFKPQRPADLPKANQLSLAGDWKIKATKPVSAPGGKTKTPDPGMTTEARELMGTEVDHSAWSTLEGPKQFEALGGDWTHRDGEVVMRRVIDVPVELVGREVILSLGVVDDFDVTFVNGKKVGAVTERGWAIERRYKLPAGLLREGENTIAVRCWDHGGGGGFTSDPSELWLGDPPVDKPAYSNPLYHPDYRDDFDLGDDPYRYYNW
jgi:hypothetical protein